LTIGDADLMKQEFREEEGGFGSEETSSAEYTLGMEKGLSVRFARLMELDEK